MKMPQWSFSVAAFFLFGQIFFRKAFWSQELPTIRVKFYIFQKFFEVTNY